MEAVGSLTVGGNQPRLVDYIDRELNLTGRLSWSPTTVLHVLGAGEVHSHEHHRISPETASGGRLGKRAMVLLPKILRVDELAPCQIISLPQTAHFLA